MKRANKTAFGKVLALFGIACVFLFGCSRDPVQLEQKFRNQGLHYLAEGKASEAIIEFRNWIKINPKSAEAHDTLGKAFVLKGWLPDAIQEFHDAAQLDPLLLDPHLQLARYGIETGQTNASNKEIETVLRISPENPDALTLNGRLNLLLGRFKKAGELYDRALLKNPKFPPAWVGKGDLFLALKKMPDARIAYQKALELNPSEQAAWIGMGNVDKASGDENGARNAFTKAFRINPKNVEAAIVLGNYDVQTHAVDQAIVLLQSVAGSHSDARIPLKIAEYKILQGHFDQAIQLLTPLENMKLNVPEVHVDLAKAYDGQGNYKRALEELNALIPLTKDNPVLLLSLAQVYVDSGNTREAERLLNTLSNAENQPIDFWRSLGRLDLSLENGQDALKVARKGLELAPGDQVLEEIEMNAAAFIGDWKQGLKIANELLKTRPNDSGILIRKVAFVEQGNGRNAARKLSDALLKAHPDDISLEVLHLRFLTLSDKPLAIKEAKAFLQSHPQATGVQEIMGELILATGDVKGAEAVLSAVHRSDPKNATAIFILERIYQTQGNPDKALLTLTEGVNALPGNPRLHQERGDVLLSMGKAVEAQAEFRDVLKSQPLNPMALFNLARLDSATGHPEEALVHLKVLKSHDIPKPFRAQVLWLSGQDYGQLGKTSKEEDAFLGAIALEPNYAPFHAGLGNYWEGRGKSGHAAEEFTKALALNPKDDLSRIKLVAIKAFSAGGTSDRKALVKLIDLTASYLAKDPKNLAVLLIQARAQVAAGHSAEGGKLYQRVLSVDSGNGSALLGLAFLDIQAHKLGSARERLEKILRKDPTDKSANLLLARVDEISGDQIGEKKALESVYSQNPGNIDTALILLEVASKSKDYGEAFTVAQGLLKDHPGMVSAQVGLVQAYEGQGNEMEALKTVRRLLDAHPKLTVAWVMKGMIESHLGRLDKAELAYRRALSLDPKNPVPYNNLALILSRKPDRLDEAKRMVERALALKDLPAIEDSAGLVSYRMGEYEKAEDYFRKAQGDHLVDPEFLYHMGRNEWKLGLLKDSQKNLEEALRSNKLSSDDKKNTRKILEKIRSKNL